MWFDCVIIDKISVDGSLESYHIRARQDERLTVDRLEDIDPSYRAVTVKDMAGIRLYDDENVESRLLSSKLSNFDLNSEGNLRLQFDHWGIPVNFGYYAVIFPENFRIRDVKIYDPYDEAENICNKRTYRGISAKWDRSSGRSCAQILMQSRRGTFSLGISAILSPSEAEGEFSDVDGKIEVEFTDPRHRGHMWEQSFRTAANRVAIIPKLEEPKFPDVKVGLSGPSISVNETWKFVAHQWNRWRTAKGQSSQ